MLVPMTKVRILGPRSELEPAIDELHRLSLVEIADARASEAVDELGGDEARRRAARLCDFWPRGSMRYWRRSLATPEPTTPRRNSQFGAHWTPAR